MNVTNAQSSIYGNGLIDNFSGWGQVQMVAVQLLTCLYILQVPVGHSTLYEILYCKYEISWIYIVGIKNCSPGPEWDELCNDEPGLKLYF